MRYLIVASSLLLGSLSSAHAQVSIGVGIAMPSVRIGINVPAYPELVPVPGYPVYYAPRASSNYFFYDGAYWVYAGDEWYVSSWYDGPWHVVEPDHVPLYVLRVPVRYYRHAPPYFRGWHVDAPPRWGHRWGHGWERRHRGWDRWDRRSVPRPAPLPAYQRNYAGARYPREAEHQHAIRSEHYRYRPREAVTRTRYEPYREPGSGHARGERHPQAPDRRGWSAPPPRENDRGDHSRRHEDQGRRYDDRGRRHDDAGRGHYDRDDHGGRHDDRGSRHEARDDRGRGHDDRGARHEARDDRGRRHDDRGARPAASDDRGRRHDERGRGY